MQYAVMKLSEDRGILVSAQEHQILLTHSDDVKDVEEDEDSMPLKLVYGSFKPQYGHDGNADAALAAMTQCKGFRLGYAEGDRCRAIELCDFVAYEPIYRGKALDIPFVALIRTHVDMPERDGPAVTAFLRYVQDMSPATNILNRPGLFAFKSQDRRRHGTALTSENWRGFADEARAWRVALKTI